MNYPNQDYDLNGWSIPGAEPQFEGLYLCREGYLEDEWDWESEAGVDDWRYVEPNFSSVNGGGMGQF